MDINLLTYNEAYEIIKNVNNITYSKEFFKFVENQNGLMNGFLKISYDNNPLLLIPVNYNKKNKIYFLPFKDYTEPLFLSNNDSNNKTIDFKKLAKEIKKKFDAKEVEINLAFINNSFKMPINSRLSTFVFKIQTTDNENNIMNKFDKKTRNEVRKSESFSIKISINGLDILNKFYQLYKENMIRHGSFAKNLDYFKNLFKCYGEKIKIIAAFDNNLLIGANLILIHNKYLKLLFNISKKEYWPKCINNLLYYQTIKFALNNNIQIIDFGPGSNKDISHNKFKINFGAKQIPIYKISATSLFYKIKNWLNQKKYHLKLRINKLKSCKI